MSEKYSTAAIAARTRYATKTYDSIKIPKELHQRIKDAASADNITLIAYIDQAISDKIAKSSR